MKQFSNETEPSTKYQTPRTKYQEPSTQNLTPSPQYNLIN